MDRGYVHEEHTADLAVRAWGPSLGAAFAEAARGLLAYMIDLDAVRPTAVRVVEAEAEDATTLLYRFLEEVRFVVETEAFVFRDFDVDVGEGRVAARGRGEPFDAAVHGHLHEIKAVTLHAIEVHAAPASVRYVVDI